MPWDELNNQILSCHRCGLCSGRQQAVPGEGNVHSPIVFIGEGPGMQEDQQGRPFVGAAGQLLDKMFLAIGLERQQVFIANVVKCRPPGNRTPAPDEVAACLPYLRTQVKLIHPKILVCLGATAAKAIIDGQLRITRDRGKWTERKGFFMIPTYHPAALLRDPSKKRDAWEDFQQIRDKLTQIQHAGENHGQES